jgi:hypothetical protein
LETVSGKEVVALRIKEWGASSTMYSWEEHLSAAPLDCKHIQESFKARRRIMADGATAFAGSEFVFAGHRGTLFEPRVGEITAHGLRHSAATAKVD